MKTYQDRTFNSNDGAEIKTTAYDGVSVSYSRSSCWDPATDKEVDKVQYEFHLTSDDARELAQNLWNSADYADEIKFRKSQRKAP